jgi:hypothetical protein
MNKDPNVSWCLICLNDTRSYYLSDGTEMCTWCGHSKKRYLSPKERDDAKREMTVGE